MNFPPDITTLFLDMNGTFMFDHDRFGAQEDYYPTYRYYGGAIFTRRELNELVRSVVSQLDELYSDVEYDRRYPQVIEVIGQLLGQSAEIATDEQTIVEQVIAAHELGTVCEENVAALTALSKRFRLYVVSNIWSASGPWRAYLKNCLDSKVLSGLVFSSDIGFNKPSSQIFNHALRDSGASPSNVMMIGDSQTRDISPARKLGMGTVWVDPNPDPAHGADLVISHFAELV